MSRVRLESVSKRFGDVVAVDGVDLEVSDRELLVLVGPSGCGKSTTLRMIAGLESPSSGVISIGERDVTSVDPMDRNIAMVFQNYALYPHKTVRGNMSFGLQMRKVGKSEIADRVSRAAKALGIGDLLDRRPSQLSGGERQRVALGRAIVRDPEVFLLDEPLSNLDAKLRVAMRSELVRLKRSLEATMVYVTHDQVEAMTMGDRIVVMHEGRIQQVGAPAEVYSQPANRFVAEFIGSPPMNVVRGTCESVDGKPVVVAGNLRLAILEEGRAGELAVGCDVDLGVRPESLVLSDESDPGEGHVSAEATVVSTQFLGAERLVELDCGGARLLARDATDLVLEEDGTCRVRVTAADVHLFDARTGARL